MKKTFKKSLSIILAVTIILGIANFAFSSFYQTALAGEADPTYVSYTTGDYVYTIIDGEAMILKHTGTLEGEFTVPSYLDGYKVTIIGESAFQSKSITNLIIPEGVKEIKGDAFSGCKNLSNIVLPESLQSIQHRVFDNTAYSNNPDNWENGLLYIGTYLIRCNEDVSSNVEIKPGTEIIAARTFSGSEEPYCNGTYINNIQSVTIPDSVRRICLGAFCYCINLSEINIADSAKGIESLAFYATEYYKDPKNWNEDALYIGKHLVEVKRTVSGNFEIKPGTVEIAAEAFKYCEDITSISIPASVNSIGYGAFIDCSIENALIPDGVTVIEKQTFSKFNNEVTLDYVHIPASVTYISGTYYNGYINYETFGNKSVIICSNTEDCYAKDYADTNGYTFKVCSGHDESPSSGTCGENATWAFDEETGTLTISGTGDMDNWVYPAYAPWYSLRENIKSVIIEDGITNIGESAFFACNNITSVTFGKDVVAIEGNAFGRCESLASITIPETVTKIGLGAFGSCTSLKDIVIPDGVTSIEMSTFSNCTALETVSIPESVTNIGKFAFDSCTALTDVYYGGSKNGWNAVTIGMYNDYLVNANIEFMGEPAPHEHSYTSSVTIPATCKVPGVMTFTCECGDSYTEEIPATDEHTPDDWITLIVPTCKRQGEQIKVCRICGETVEREMIPMAEHTPGDWVTVNDSTCNAEGKKVKICSACGDEVANETIPVKEHTPGNWEVTKKASCGAEGTESLKCSVCGYVISTRTVAALEHEESEEWFVNKPPTCSEEGIKQKKCIHCGKAMGAYEKIEKLPHKPGSYWINDIQPTCTEEGLKIKKCTVCGEVAEKEVIPANGHLSVGDWIIETYPSCDGAGRKVKYCSVCGEISQEILINPEGHSSSAEWFLRKEATCTEDGEYYKKCTVCGMDTETKSIDKLGHDLGEWSVTKPATCSEDGIKTRKCIRCDYSETEPLPSSGHDFEGEWKTTTPATCTENGIESLFCKNCSHSLTREIPATGHSAGEWEIIKKADCKNTGTQVKRCKKCNNIIYSETIPVSGHSAGNWIITKTPQNGNYGIKSKFCTGCGMKLEEKIIHSINNLVVRDAVTGIEIIYPEESFDGNIAMRAGFLSGSDLGNKVFNEIGKCTFKGYEATLIHNGEYVTPEKSYSLRLPLPDGMNHKTAEVYTIDTGSGRFVKVDASYENGYFLIDKVEAVQYVVIERIITLTLSEANLSLKKGDSVQIHAYTEGGNVTYTSSNSSVATVDIHGNIKAVGAGTATITATVDGTTVKAECSVEVTQSFFDMIIEAFTNFFKMIAELFGF